MTAISLGPENRFAPVDRMPETDRRHDRTPQRVGSVRSGDAPPDILATIPQDMVGREQQASQVWEYALGFRQGRSDQRTAIGSKQSWGR